MRWPWSKKSFEPLDWNAVFRLLTFQPAEVTVQAATVNHDRLTRLDCRELNALHDGTINGLILLEAQYKLFRIELAELSKTNSRQALIGMTKIYTELGHAIERFKQGLNWKE